MQNTDPTTVQPPLAAILSPNPVGWLAVFGPGAVIASITLGSGELVFSARGGALFGYRVLFLFVVISLLKWGLVFAMARHMTLSGVHPYTRMMSLPGPRGWFPLMLLMIAAVTTPVWIGFHPGILGNFTSWMTGTNEYLNGAIDYLWALVFLAAAVTLSFTSGYAVLERVQMVIVALMMACAFVSLVLYHPDWLELVKGAVVPQRFEYPAWLISSENATHVRIASDPVWVETTRYVGVIGGAGFDYLAYTSWIREKHWGWAGIGTASQSDLHEMAEDSSHPARLWIRAPLIDCTISFLLIVAFSGVFVASGVVVLAPQHEVPSADNFLELQAEFVTSIHPWLKPIYVLAAYLTMFGTLYGVIEIGVTICREIVHAMNPNYAQRHASQLKRFTVIWCAVGAICVLAWSFIYTYSGGADKRLLLKILTPANLFTGVLSCGLFCLLMPWIDWRFLPPALRMPWWLWWLNVVSGVIFLALGIRGYWENHDPNGPLISQRWFSIGGILGVAAVSIVIAWIRGKTSRLSQMTN